MGVAFRYEHCPELREASAIDLIAGAWLACKPLVDLARLSVSRIMQSVFSLAARRTWQASRPPVSGPRR